MSREPLVARWHLRMQCVGYKRALLLGSGGEMTRLRVRAVTFKSREDAERCGASACADQPDDFQGFEAVRA